MRKIVLGCMVAGFTMFSGFLWAEDLAWEDISRGNMNIHEDGLERDG